MGLRRIKMKKVIIDKVSEGAKLAKAILSPEGRVLLQPGVKLRKSLLNKLKAHNVYELFIEDKISSDIEVRDAICQQTRIEAKNLVKQLMNDYASSNSINIGPLKGSVDKMIEELLSNRDLLVSLSNIRCVDDYTFEHSVNVCILSLATGVGLGYDRRCLKELGVGAILHDIGKLKVPEEILKKPSRLTAEEFEEIKKHTIYGYKILRENKDISIRSALIALSHHERIDGSGYPLKLLDKDIHQFGKIVAVADVYDALTSDRVYRDKLNPHEGYDYITSLGYYYFDRQVIDSFTKFVAIYPVGSGVALSTRERGIVIRINKNMPTRPVVRVIYNENNEELENYYEIDLAKKLNVCITGVCEI
jgi:HD-GYP domain-containing protein (c-di-GMP phosphodiesterase class II)